MKPPRALYVHIPFCRSKCAYCDFFSRPSADRDEETDHKLVQSILSRADSLLKRFGPARVETIYIGGGTPSVLARPALKRLFEGLHLLLPRNLSEWTIEANPESLDESFLSLVKDSPITRISLGIQSLDDETLRFLGRAHDGNAAIRALRLAAASGLRISADLMTGIPREAGAAAEARLLLSEGLGHISVYDLVLEEGTPLAAAAGRGDVRLPSEDEAADERQELSSILEHGGLRRYEISNYAAPGQESFHNLSYWAMDSYIGAGPGAVSTLWDGVKSMDASTALRIEEGRSVDAYLEGRASECADEVRVGAGELAFESFMMATRTVFGLDRGAFARDFGVGPESLFGKSLEAWKDRLSPGLPWPGRPAGAAGYIALRPEWLDFQGRLLRTCLEELEDGGHFTQAPSSV